MSTSHWAETARALLDQTAQLAWNQWSAIGGSATKTTDRMSIIDPEALILGSLFLVDVEPRIHNVLFSWIETNAALLSVQRLRNLQKDHPAHAQTQVAQFGKQARLLVKHPRWNSLVGDDRHTFKKVQTTLGKATSVPLQRPSNLMLRLRMALGVGVKADVLTVVLGSHQPVLGREVRDWLRYSDVAVRGALDDLARTGFLKATDNKGGAYVAPRSEWRALLDIRTEPRWVPWHLWYAFAIDFWSWSQSPKTVQLSEYAADVKLRELREKHGLFFRYFAHELRLPALQNDLGTSQEMFASLSEWLAGYTHRQSAAHS